MQFSLAVLALLASGACAAPLDALSNRANSCVAALAPSFPTVCDPAAAQLGANTPFNTACLAAAAKGTAAFPNACTPCAAQFGVTDPGNKAQSTPNGATGNGAANNGAPTNGANAPGAVTQPRPRAQATCDIKACVVALQPSFPLCAPAVAQAGAQTSLNSACLVAAAKGTAPFPNACDGCAAQFGVTDPGAKTQTGAGSPANKAPNH
ncbi:hypothetical protein B0H19DRAFT_1273938 [Mycena capillaripes]|nr:hypothetical protein B0H19DRAFT_1273938 [Mycena capillaripes]